MTKTQNPNQEATMTLTARKLGGVRWIDQDGNVRGYLNNRLMGVTDGEGRWLTFGGQDSPGAWDKRTATEIAETIDTSAPLQWIAAVR